jgi:hypothetical protein
VLSRARMRLHVLLVRQDRDQGVTRLAWGAAGPSGDPAANRSPQPDALAHNLCCRTRKILLLNARRLAA